jgi:hypothetical protein
MSPVMPNIIYTPSSWLDDAAAVGPVRGETRSP